MEYGQPQNFRVTDPREDKRVGPTKKKFGMKKFGLKLTLHRTRWRLRHIEHTQWYKKESGRDHAFKHLSKQKQWFYPTKPYYAKVEKVER